MERNTDGTYKEEDYNQYIGKKYGELVVLEVYSSNNAEGRKRCKCKCKCGKIIDIGIREIKLGRKKHCGCVQREKIYDELIGKKFGRLLITGKLPYEKLIDAQYECICECGNLIHISRENLLRNKIKSCGCIQKISQYNDTIHKSNKSGVKGVHLDKSSNKWMAKLTIKGKVYKKRFDRFEDAIKYRKYLEDEYHKPLKEEYMKIKNSN